jgi:putative SOS response-associated peptidase YedK
VPFTSFSENETLPDGRTPPVCFAFDETRPLAFFAGIWTRWTSVRKVKEGETTNDLYAFLTTEPNKEVGAIHPKAMPAIPTTAEEIEIWMTAPECKTGPAIRRSPSKFHADQRIYWPVLILVQVRVRSRSRSGSACMSENRFFLTSSVG